MEDKFDLENAIQTNVEFSYVIAVIYRIGGWEEEAGLGSRFAASMRIYTKAVGQKNMQNYRLVKLRSIVEAVNWRAMMPLTACVGVGDDHLSARSKSTEGSAI